MSDLIIFTQDTERVKKYTVYFFYYVYYVSERYRSIQYSSLLSLSSFIVNYTRQRGFCNYKRWFEDRKLIQLGNWIFVFGKRHWYSGTYRICRNLVYRERNHHSCKYHWEVQSPVVASLAVVGSFAEVAWSTVLLELLPLVRHSMFSIEDTFHRNCRESRQSRYSTTSHHRGPRNWCRQFFR